MSDYYNLSNIKKENADYNIIIGERSNGKTYALLHEILINYKKTGKQSAYIRRFNEDILTHRASSIFNPFTLNNEIKKLFVEYDTVVYIKRAWHLGRFDTEKNRMKVDKNPFCYAFSLGAMEHDKSTSYPNINLIVFDEFITRMAYLPNEFVLFMNVLSTIIRDRNDAKIYLIGNTVNKFCPYFSEMGITNIDKQIQGSIDVYNFANTLKIAVEYCKDNSKSKKSNKYFAFDNPHLQMINSGKWEIALYKHLPENYKIEKKDILFEFGIEFNNKKIGCFVVSKNDDIFIFCYPKTREFSKCLIYSNNYEVSIYTRKSFLNPIDKIDSRIKKLFASERVFYSDNETGELVHNYLLNCTK